MRINKFIALCTGMSRRAADAVIARDVVLVNGKPPTQGQDITDADTVTMSGRPLHAPQTTCTVMLHKPPGYVVSRDGQGSRTIYDLIPIELHSLKPIGRLDKDSSGLLLLTNDGALTQELTHPSHEKIKIYEIELDKPLQPLHRQMVSDHGIQLSDGVSRLELERLHNGNDRAWRIRMHEGRNRQIRRTFAALNYMVVTLYRTNFGTYALGDLKPGSYKDIQ
jgi:pseudouridine synthase